jgi:II/X family phage/plasmid replication protein
MVDFVSVTFTAALPRLIRAGTRLRVKEDGEVDWEISERLTLPGSYSSSVQIRAASPNVLEVSGNLAKFMQGHNLFGPSDLGELVRAFLERVQPTLWPEGMPWIDVPGGELSRVDCTSGFLLERPSDVLTWLRAAADRGSIERVGQARMYMDGKTGKGSTIVYGDSTGKRAKNWQLTFYAKGVETVSHPLPEPIRARADVLDWVNRLLRAEVRLRRGELRRIGLECVGNWGPGSVRQCWQEKIDRLDFAEGLVMDCTAYEGVKPRLLDCFDAWQAGRDLAQGRPKASFYRLRKEMRQVFGVDIRNVAPKSNVVPLRRTIVATPAQRPPWADEVSALLAA